METTNQTQTSGMMANPLTLPLILGLVGAALMVLGTFLPFVGFGGIASVNALKANGVLIVICAVVAAICFMVKFYFIPIIASLLAGCVLAYDLYNMLYEPTKPWWDKTKGLQVEIGVFVIAVGIISVSATAIWSYRIKRKMKQGK